MKKVKLKANELKTSYTSEDFAFETTNDLALENEMLAQKEAVDMFLFGLQMKTEGYNLYISGNDEQNLQDYLLKKTQEIAKTSPTPQDLCYLYNFEDPSAPKYLMLEAGSAKALKDDLEEFRHFLLEELPEKLESVTLEKQRQQLLDELEDEKQALVKMLKQEAKALGFEMKLTEEGIGFIPFDVEGEVISTEDYDNFDEKSKDEMKLNIDRLYDLSAKVINETKQLEKDYEQKLKTINEEIVLNEVDTFIAYMQKQHRKEIEISSYLEAIRNDLLDNIDVFDSEKKEELEGLTQIIPWLTTKTIKDVVERYNINILVNHEKTCGAPVVTDLAISYSKLYGRIKIDTELTSTKSDYMSIYPGVLHEANKGYLILKMNDLLDAPGTWEGIKQALKTKKITMESLGGNTITTTIGIRPQPIPLDLKVILIGSYDIYQLLSGYDPQFKNLFKLHVHFDETIESTVSNTMKFGRLIKTYCETKGLPPVTKNGVKALLEYSHRQAESKEKISAYMGEVYDLIQEASVFAEDCITETNIKSIQKIRGFFKDNIERKLNQECLKNRIMIDTTGKKIGQINGLAVYEAEDYRFGRPTRITVTTYRGKSGVLDIESEVGLSGRTHSKGIEIIKGCLGHYFAKDYPLSLSCRICFEQSYGGIDGDSASSAELYAILSSLSELPIRQGIAVTGSMNQYGMIQPIGGVNDKIEGFYKVCKQKGLTGNQGVIIPYQNKEDLMLDDEIIESVEKENFHIYAIESFKQGIQLLVGKPYQEIEERIQDKLKRYSDVKSRRLF